jgi:hypothetical protein
MNRKMIFSGIVCIVIGFAILGFQIATPPPVVMSENWCSMQTHIMSNFNPMTTAGTVCVIFGCILISLGCAYGDVVGETPRKDYGVLMKTPLWVLENLARYEFDPKRDPPISEIVCRYEGKEYVFKIASIEVRDEKK